MNASAWGAGAGAQVGFPIAPAASQGLGILGAAIAALAANLLPGEEVVPRPEVPPEMMLIAVGHGMAKGQAKQFGMAGGKPVKIMNLASIGRSFFYFFTRDVDG